ncbi:MAG: hypothetical protein RLO11_00100 [Salinisphaeraceae bacterium]
MSNSNDGDSRFTVFPGQGKPDATADLIRHLKATRATQIELQGFIAEIIRAKYDALLEQGFTEAQALELSKTISA